MLVTLQIMPTAKMNATIFASALKSSSCCINIVFGFGGKSKSDATIPDVVGCRSPSFALIGYGICLESEKIYTFVGEYSKGACLNIHHSLFPAVKRGNLNGKQAGRLNFEQAGQVELRAFTARGSAVCFVALCRA